MNRLRDKIDKKLIENKIILDIGTGPSSIEFLSSIDPKKIYAISHDSSEISESRNIQTTETEIEYIKQDLSLDEGLKINEKTDENSLKWQNVELNLE